MRTNSTVLLLGWCLFLLGSEPTFGSRLLVDIEEIGDDADLLNQSMAETKTKPFPLLLAAVPWLMAGGATYTAVSVADYYSQVDAANKLSYMQLPAAETCLASNASTSAGLFVSKANERVSDLLKCSLCNSFISGMIGMGVEELPTKSSSTSLSIFSLPSALMHHNSSRFTREISNMTLEACTRQIVPDDEFAGDGATMLDKCLAQGVALLKEHPQIIDKLKLITRATTKLSDEFVANVICEDLQCCPQDPFAAEMVANLAANQTDVQTLKSHGAIGALLDKPEVVVMLEVVEENLAFSKLSQLEELDDQQGLLVGADDNSDTPAIATHCTWKYNMARCMPSDLCQYHYKFGDLTLSQSCRTKEPTHPKVPTTDEECMWNRALGKCSTAEVCSRQCRSSDTDLNECCRLISQDSEEEHHEESAKNCGGEGDLMLMNSQETTKQLDSIGTSSFNVWRMNIDAKKSLKLHMEFGFSERCASCFVEMSACVIDKCFSLVAANKNSDASKKCIADFCQPTLLTCSGVAQDKLPKEQSDNSP